MIAKDATTVTDNQFTPVPPLRAVACAILLLEAVRDNGHLNYAELLELRAVLPGLRELRKQLREAVKEEATP